MIEAREGKMTLMPVADDSVLLHKLIVEIRVGGLELEEINLVTLHQQVSREGGTLLIELRDHQTI